MFSSFFGKNIHTRVYLDNAGATEVEKESAQAFVETLGVYGNPSGIHKEGAQASQILDGARVACANVLNAHSYEIYFVGSGTESCNLAILGTYNAFARTQKTITSDLYPHVITSVIEHPSVLEPIRNLEREGKISATYLPVYEEGIVRVKDLIEALTSETILVSIMYANNEVGTIQPVKEIGRAIENWKREKNIAHTAYPYFHTDACQAANYCNLDVLRIKAHLMTVNSSKVYGPKGSALLYKREGVRLDPIVYGGGQERMLRSGTENIASIYAFSVALTNAHQMQDTESARLRALRDETVSSLKKQIPDIIFYGAFDEYQTTHSGEEKKGEGALRTQLRLPNNINCRVPGISSEEMILRLDAQGFAVSHKSACASMETDGSYVVMALGASEADARENIRISMGRKTTQEDMKQFVAAVLAITTKYKNSNH